MTRSKMKELRLTLVLPLFFALTTLFAACDAGETIHYENKTNETLFLILNQSGLRRLSAGKAGDLDYLKYGSAHLGSGRNPLRIFVIDAHGCAALDINTTVGEFKKEHHFSLVINPSDITPVASRASCDPRLADIATRTRD